VTGSTVAHHHNGKFNPSELSMTVSIKLVSLILVLGALSACGSGGAPSDAQTPTADASTPGPDASTLTEDFTPWIPAQTGKPALHNPTAKKQLRYRHALPR
jgi:hypothetical protein